MSRTSSNSGVIFLGFGIALLAGSILVSDREAKQRKAAERKRHEEEERQMLLAMLREQQEREKIMRLVAERFNEVANALGVQAPPLRFDDTIANAQSDGQVVSVNLGWVHSMLAEHCHDHRCDLAFVIAVLAHELGHHLHADALVPLRIRDFHGQELRADYCSGFALAWFGGEPGYVERIFAVIAAHESVTHPAARRRIQAIRRGFEDTRAYLASLAIGQQGHLHAWG
jgi:hypothetical protein